MFSDMFLLSICSIFILIIAHLYSKEPMGDVYKSVHGFGFAPKGSHPCFPAIWRVFRF